MSALVYHIKRANLSFVMTNNENAKTFNVLFNILVNDLILMIDNVEYRLSVRKKLSIKVVVNASFFQSLLPVKRIQHLQKIK